MNDSQHCVAGLHTKQIRSIDGTAVDDTEPIMYSGSRPWWHTHTHTKNAFAQYKNNNNNNKSLGMNLLLSSEHRLFFISMQKWSNCRHTATDEQCHQKWMIFACLIFAFSLHCCDQHATAIIRVVFVVYFIVRVNIHCDANSALSRLDTTANSHSKQLTKMKI